MKLTDRWLSTGKWVVLCLIATALAWMACAQSVTTATVQGTVYLANGTPGQGTLQLSWPAFTTANNQAVAAGRTAVTIGADGFVSVNLAANLGSWPAGLYYTATYYLNDGSTSTEYWVVPAAAQASIAQVRSQVMPAAQAVQAVSKAYVDQAIQSIPQSSLGPSGGTMTGPLYLSGDPLQTLQAADKHYVDSAFSQTVPLTGASLTGPINGPSVSASVNKVLLVTAPPYNAKCDGVTDDQAAIQSALNAAKTNNYSVQFPAGTCLTSTLTYYGQSIFGAGVSQTTLQGKPGQDVLATPDSAATLIYGAVIRDMTIAVDASVNAASSAVGGNNTFPNRYTGVGAGITAGTPVALPIPLAIGQITYTPGVSGNCGVYINDGVHSTSLSVMYASCANNYGAPAALFVGAPVSIAGAGPSGGVLNTTVASIASYWSVNLAKPATAAVSNVAATLGYTAAGTGTQPPWYCGNAGIAIPTSNGAAMPINLNGWVFRNLQIQEVNQTAGNAGNYACGIFIQAASNALRFENIDVMNMWGGIIEAPPASNNSSYFAWTPDTNSYKDVNLKFG